MSGEHRVELWIAFALAVAAALRVWIGVAVCAWRDKRRYESSRRGE